MKNLLLFLILFPLFATAQQKRLDSVCTKEKDFCGVLLVAGKGKIIYQKAFGYRQFSPKIPLQKSDIFELASVSKQFTAMIIMMLKEKGLLRYDDLVEKYISIPYKKITIRNLLTHTNGLPDYQAIMDEHWDKTKVAGNADCIEYLNKFAPAKSFEPGTKYEYSNTGYLLLASIAEKVTGKDFIDLCRQWIFRPLQMKSTDVRTLTEKAAIKNFALGHIFVSDRQQYVRADSFPSTNYTIWLGNRKGPGRISATAADLLKWDRALYSNKLVKKSTLQEAFTPMKLLDGNLSYYGFGWMLRAENAQGKVVYHTGDNPGYKTEIIRFIDQQKTIIILNNNAHENFEKMVSAIEAIVQ